jgi:hypothetical protein
MDHNHAMSAIATIRQIQAEMYSELGGKLLEYATHEYLALCKLLHYEPELGAKTGSGSVGEYPILKTIYDRLAVSFTCFPPGQAVPVLQNDPQETGVLIRRAWQNFFILEAHRLTKIPSFTDRLMNVVTHGANPVGREAESELAQFLEKEYPRGSNPVDEAA